MREELVSFTEEELDFLKRLFSIIGGFASSLPIDDAEQHTTLQVDISTKNDLVEISIKGEPDDS